MKSFFRKEPVLCIAALCAVVSMFFVKPSAEYFDYIDWRTLGLLWCLMAVVAGLRHAGLFELITHRLLSGGLKIRTLAVILVLLPFFAAMAVTNDVALLTFVPFTLGVLAAMEQTERAVPVLVLQTVGANLGSMVTPVGNPQNLYLFGHYELGAAQFFPAVLPIAAVSGVLLAIGALFVLPENAALPALGESPEADRRLLLLYGALFALSLLAVFRVLPWWIALLVTAAVMFLADRKRLREPDTMLLLTFTCFFVFSGNLGRMEPVRAFLAGLLEKNALLTAALTSQIISNVPAAVLLSGFTENWRALLLGTNIGGLGTPVASLASLITMKLYFRSENAQTGRFLAVFSAVNLAGLILLLLFAEYALL